MSKRTENLTLSIFCSMMLSSAYVATVDGVAMAGMGSGVSERIQAQVNSQLQDLGKSGWAFASTSLPMAPVEVPGASASRAVVASQAIGESPWPGIVEKIYKEKDKDTAIFGKLCTWLGFSTNNESLGFRQLQSTEDPSVVHHDLNVRKTDSGELQIMFVMITPDRQTWTAFRMNANGVVEKAAYRKDGGAVQTVGEAPFPAGFESERDRWLERFGEKVASK